MEAPGSTTVPPGSDVEAHGNKGRTRRGNCGPEVLLQPRDGRRQVRLLSGGCDPVKRLMRRLWVFHFVWNFNWALILEGEDSFALA